jgi:hypothetical protein
MAQLPILKGSFGSCGYDHASPLQADLKPTTQVLNVVLSFEDALKLNLAIQEGLRKLNSYNRSMAKGKNMGLGLAIYLEKIRVTVTEKALSKKPRI